MKITFRRILLKTLLAIFTVLLMTGTVLGSMTVGHMADNGFYFHHSYRFILDNAFKSQAVSYSRSAIESYLYEHFEQYYSDPDERYYLEDAIYSSYGLTDEDSNFYYELLDKNGKSLASRSLPSKDYQYSFTLYYDVHGFYYSFSELPSAGDYLILHGHISTDLNADDSFRFVSILIQRLYSMRYGLIIFTGLSLLLSVFLLLFLGISAAERARDSARPLSFYNRFPYDLLLVLFAIPIGITFAVFDDGSQLASVLPCIALDIFLLMLLLATTIVRGRAGTLLRDTLIGFLVRHAAVLCRKLAKSTRTVCRELSLHIAFYWKAIALFVLIALLELFVQMAADCSDLIFVWFLEKLLLAPPFLLILFYMRRLHNAGKMLAAGNLDYKMDTRPFFGVFREHAEDLNSIRLGIQSAVEDRLHSERFKTELITNISHDIKTPLTSIINYVDLIKKEELPNETLKDYVEVLDRQSARLKKLIEDLIEASKASTGNLPVELSSCEVGILLGQAAAEYGERLEKANLNLIITVPENPVTILADGRHLWRIFDNLLSNICKYAQPHTRVYLNLESLDQRAVITFRNISSSQLNISAEDLMERFVRGDASRNTEGSGLGLSIAKSLTELQHGQMRILIDGDLFKVVLIFDQQF